MEFRIKEAREKAGMTQAQLAEKLGINNVTLSGYETGRHDPKSNTLVLIAKICNTTVDYLLGREHEKSDRVEYSGADESRLLTAYRKLNDEGKKSAVGIVESMTLNPDYTEDTSNMAM